MPSTNLPLASHWTEEKNASVDWTNPDDVLENGFTFLQILAAHPRLAAYFSEHCEESTYFRSLFITPHAEQKQHEALRQWHHSGLLTLREHRWCRYCGLEDHTRRTCPLRSDRTATSTQPHSAVVNQNAAHEGTDIARPQVSLRPSGVLAKFIKHQQQLERVKLLEEKKRRQADHGVGSASLSTNDNSGGSGGGRQDRQPNARDCNQGSSKESKELSLFAEERRRGVIGRVDWQYGIGFVRLAELGEVKFFVDRVDFGVKEVAVGDVVTLKVDHSRDYPLAVDVRPERPVISEEDALKFIKRCKNAPKPITILTMLLTHRHEWFEVLRKLTNMELSHNMSAYVEGVHTLVELTTFVGNREPIHLSMLESFLRLTTTLTPSQDTPATSTAFFPDMVRTALENRHVLAAPADTSTEHAALFVADRWVEMANYIVLLRQFTCVAWATVEPVQQLLEAFFLEKIAANVANRRSLETALRRLRGAAAGRVATLLLPSATELAVPPPNPESPFAPANLPVNGAVTYATTQDFVVDQCRLLRADTFEATSRVLPAVCYDLPSYTPSAETLSDAEHARLFGRVRFMGKVLTRDRDYSQPESYIFYVEPKSIKASLSAQLHPGTTVCITTQLDKTTMTEGELFWGVISSCDARLLRAGMVVVAPASTSAPFDQLIANLARNAAAGQVDAACLLETPIFLAGYAAILKALGAFIGPLAMPLPMARQIVGPAAAEEAQQGNAEAPAVAKPRRRLISYVPPHCERAFREFTSDIRSRFALDAGQDEVMRRLPTSEILLVQGPPGTGKSFIGCRVVEAYVRYKQLVASGDILQKVDVDMLSSTKPEHLLPRVGPVVVITYKNHALDEFLVDLLKSDLWSSGRPRVGQYMSTEAAGLLTGDHKSNTKQGAFPGGRRLVRIGGRSREARLDGHNLGALLHGAPDKSTINSLKERIFIMTQRLNRLTKEIHYLECGRVPRAYFERWLTAEQRQHIRFEDREEWLRGARYVGLPQVNSDGGEVVVDKTRFLTILRTQMAAALAASGDATETSAVTVKSAEVDEDVSLSIFQEMKREDESREFNNTLHTSYLSAEAVHLARCPPRLPDNVPEDLMSLWSLDPVCRHEYYAYLIQLSISTKARDCLTILEAIHNVVNIRNHAIDEAKLALLQGADVIGLTTTGCAMNQNLLRSLRPSVLVVEEAAEVLESQLLACFTDSLRQVVLIGDHYQLQPKVETFMYEKVNHLNLSLFERLSRGIMPICLTEQRRMHPAISQLVRPFYNLQPLLDHSSLLSRPFITASGQCLVDRVPGLLHRVYFWRHHYPEEESPGSRSKVNTREVCMTQQVVRHLVSQGVLQRSITVITPYLGQCRMLRNVLRISSLADIRVSTVDLYQGDENDIIVLSLVRTEKLTEFIRLRNRLIVSCSRARFAMVMVGNDHLLRQCSHWDQVLRHLEAQDCVGDRLPITYRDHPAEVKWLEVHGSTSAAALESGFDLASSRGTAAVQNEEKEHVSAEGLGVQVAPVDSSEHNEINEEES